MSNNPQWNSFQSHILNSSDASLLRYKSLSIASKNVPSPGNHFSMQSNNNMYNYPMQQSKRPNSLFNADNHFSTPKFDSMSYEKSPIENFPPIGVFNADLFNEKTNNIMPVNSNRSHFGISCGDTTNNQGTRETGIIEKLLVSFCLGINFIRFTSLY